MIDIDEFFAVLTEVCDEIPDEFFRELHHGVILSEDLKYSPYADKGDMVIMGEYSHSRIGNRITIYYGSFAKSFPRVSREEIRDRLREVVRHEFRHHLENLGGVRGSDSLEREDEIQIRQYRRNRGY